MRKPLFLIRTYIVMYSLNHVDVNAVIVCSWRAEIVCMYVCIVKTPPARAVHGPGYLSSGCGLRENSFSLNSRHYASIIIITTEVSSDLGVLRPALFLYAGGWLLTGSLTICRDLSRYLIINLLPRLHCRFLSARIAWRRSILASSALLLELGTFLFCDIRVPIC